MIDPRNPRLSAAQNKSIGIIILAAGASLRMKEPKQLLSFEGKTLLRRAVDTSLQSICRPVVVVLGANFEWIKAEIADLPVEIVFNPDWQIGMSSTARAGIENLLRLAPDTSAAVIMLCDQPFVGTDQLHLFAAKFEQTNAQVIAARYDETVGVPALFSRSVFDDFKSLSGSGGAKPIIEKYRASLLTIDLPEAAFDIDTPQDYLNLKLKNGG
jgi:molybdenum cofactor cytidylyltransferase